MDYGPIPGPDEDYCAHGTAVAWGGGRAAPVDIERTFFAAYAELRERASTLAEDATLVAAFEQDGRGAGLAELARRDSGLAYLVVGRHPQAHVRLARDPTTPLRHLIVRWVRDAAGEHQVDVRDLRTGLGFGVPGLGVMSGARATGHLFVRVGSALLMILPKRLWRGRWPAEARKAWESLPPLELQDQREAKVLPALARPRRATRRPGSEVTSLPPLRALEVSRPALPIGEQHGVLTLSAGNASVTYPVRWSELQEGVLVGRYPRCQLGVELDMFMTWSRVHLLLIAEHGDLLAFDTASTTGTVIDAQHMDCAVLGQRSVMALGPEVHLVWERTA